MKFKTCVSLAEKTPKKFSQILEKALKKSDYAELRLDFLNPSQVPETLQLTKKHLKKCICTLRPKSEGGKFSGTESERISIIKLISEFNPFLLDIEFNTIRQNKGLEKYLKSSKSNLLISWHDFARTPNKESLNKLKTRLEKFSKNIKIVTFAKKPEDAGIVLSLYNNPGKVNLIAFAMGDLGKMSRLLSLYLGSPFTYVSLGKPIAPGQFSLEEIKSIIK